MVTPKTKQWLGAEVPWADYKRAIDYVSAHKAQGMTVGKLIVAGAECYFGALDGKPATKELIVSLLGFDPTGVVAPPKAEAIDLSNVPTAEEAERVEVAGGKILIKPHTHLPKTEAGKTVPATVKIIGKPEGKSRHRKGKTLADLGISVTS